MLTNWGHCSLQQEPLQLYDNLLDLILVSGLFVRKHQLPTSTTFKNIGELVELDILCNSQW